MARLVTLIFAFGAAVMAAILLATIAHNDLGIARATIRVGALASAAFVGAALASGGLLRR